MEFTNLKVFDGSSSSAACTGSIPRIAFASMNLWQHLKGCEDVLWQQLHGVVW